MILGALLPFAFVLSATTQKPPWDNYLTALAWVESRGNDNAVGRAGEIGRYQILEPYWRDSGMPGSWKQCRNARYAGTVVWWYAFRYEQGALVAKDWRTLAMLHHCGPGFRDAKWAVERERYWARVQKAMGDSTLRTKGGMR